MLYTKYRLLELFLKCLLYFDGMTTYDWGKIEICSKYLLYGKVGIVGKLFAMRLGAIPILENPSAMKPKHCRIHNCHTINVTTNGQTFTS